ncbi:MAG: bile acid:sodium symporter family protein [Bacteroidales bacterium]
MEFSTQLLYDHDKILLAIMIFVIMLGMGSSLTVDDFKAVGRRPKGVLIGFLSQFGLMPLLALGLSTVLQLHPAFAISLILVGSLPGGTTSNMFTYFSRGSVALSISMTTASTMLALVMMPLILQFYTRPFVSELSASQGTTEFIIPTGNIISSLVLVLIPVVLGMILRRKSPVWAKTAEDTAGFVGIIVIIYLLGTSFTRHGALMSQTPWTLYVGAIGLGLAGFFFGFWFSRLWGVYPVFQRAISLETGIQNGPVAFAVILLSFTGNVQNMMLWLAILYSTTIVLTSSIITLFYRHYGRRDWEIYKNTQVHNRLFGDDFVTKYPQGFLPKRLENDPSQGTIPSQRRVMA